MEWVKNVAKAISIPLTVGGGISSLEDIERVLEAGVSKVSMNSAAVKNPNLIDEALKRFDSDTITIAIDGKRNGKLSFGFEVVVAGGTKSTGKDAVM